MAAIRKVSVVVGVLLVPAAYISAYDTLALIMPPVLYALGGLVLIILAVGGLGGAWLFVQMLRTRVAQLANQRIIAEAEAIEATVKAQHARIMVITAPRDHQLVVRDENLDSYYRQLHLAPQSHVNGLAAQPTPEEVQLYQAYHGQGSNKQLVIEAQAQQAESELPLLPELAPADNILIVGGKGSGKTSLLQWLEAERIGRQEIVIMDSHAEPAQWQGRMVGFGRNYEEILREMKTSLRELNIRYKRRTRGDKTYTMTTSIIDEFTLLPETLKTLYEFDIRTYSRPLLTEGRKVRMNCIWGIHSDRVEALGMKGAGDLKECFDVVVHLKNVRGHYYATCDFGEGKEDIRYTHPGPFVCHERVRQEGQRPRPTPEEREKLLVWWQMKRAGTLSGNQLHQKLTGQTTNASSAQIQKLRNMVTKFGEDPGF